MRRKNCLCMQIFGFSKILNQYVKVKTKSKNYSLNGAILI